jgi:hypothetical protein
MNGRNSLWRIHEAARTVGSREVAGWLEVGEIITLGSKIIVEVDRVLHKLSDHLGILGILTTKNGA